MDSGILQGEQPVPVLAAIPPERQNEAAPAPTGADTFLLNRMAHRRGGYIGNGAVFRGLPVLPHGLHGVFISRYAKIGRGCWIYQNVTTGEVDRAAPEIGDGCLIGAGAVIVGGVKIGDRVKIGAGAVVSFDVPDGCTVVAQPPRVISREARL